MVNHQIKIEVVKTCNMCPRKLSVGSFVVLQNIPGAEVPQGICARAFHSIYPSAMGMRFSDQTYWEQGQGYLDITCPDGHVVYRLSRVGN